MVRSRRRRVAVEVLLAPHDPLAADGADGLSHEDRSRASAIGDAGERARFFGGRRLLRQALAEYTGVPSRDLQIASGRNGQAFLLGGGPFFSLAHSDDWYAVALCHDFPVGVAVAPTAASPGLGSVIGALLPAAAHKEIEGTPPAARDEMTVRWWVTMEAAVRACGAGRDQAAACLARVSTEVGRPIAREIVAVAGCTPRPLQAQWRVLTAERAGAPA